MANPRKPRALKIIAGTDQPSRRPEYTAELPLVADAPDPPTWLPNAFALAEWERLAPILIANKLLTVAGLTTFGQLCAVHGAIVQQYQAGVAPNASYLAQYRGLANDFGLTPVAQGKVKPSGETKPENKFTSHAKRPA